MNRVAFLSKCLLILILATGPGARLLKAQTAESESYFEISKNLEIFNTLFKELNSYYVDPVQPGKVVKKRH
ncbi:MAG: hypothetical protein IPN26_10750 [Bacteroidetes bacterium]|nr:hypothetical protein [Bacteroidota bacterium]